jgi:predicted DNA-binding transcriptional regulator AlpA
MEREGRFPASHYISPNRRAWFADEIAAWQSALPPNRRFVGRLVQGGSKA